METFKMIETIGIKDTDKFYDLIEFGNGYGLMSNIARKNKNIKTAKTMVSLPIAIAVSAYARMYINKFKVMYQDNLYYSDTDSIIQDVPLDDMFIGTELGKFKLECLVNRGVFLGPKLYGLEVIDDKGENATVQEIVKSKGFKKKISFNEILSLLEVNESLNLSQEKWFRSIKQGNISIKETPYNLKVNNNKRLWVIENNKYSYTIPYNVDITDDAR